MDHPEAPTNPMRQDLQPLVLVHPDGESATALAAAAQGSGMVLSIQSSVAMDDIPAEASTCRWLQLFLLPDRQATLGLVRHAEAC